VKAANIIMEPGKPMLVDGVPSVWCDACGARGHVEYFDWHDAAHTSGTLQTKNCDVCGGRCVVPIEEHDSASCTVSAVVKRSALEGTAFAVFAKPSPTDRARKKRRMHRG
jgi:hypothetical protein